MHSAKVSVEDAAGEAVAVAGEAVAVAGDAVNEATSAIAAEAEADAELIGLRALTLDLRETQSNAIRTYESRGYTRWGTQPQYALIDGQWIAGYHYTKELR